MSTLISKHLQGLAFIALFCYAFDSSDPARRKELPVNESRAKIYMRLGINNHDNIVNFDRLPFSGDLGNCLSKMTSFRNGYK